MKVHQAVIHDYSVDTKSGGSISGLCKVYLKSEADAEIERLKAEYEALKKTSSFFDNQYYKLKKEYADACKWATDYENQVVDLKANRATDQEIITGLHQDKIKLQSDLTTAQARIKVLTEALEKIGNKSKQTDMGHHCIAKVELQSSIDISNAALKGGS